MNNGENTTNIVDASHYIRVLAHDGKSPFTLWLDPMSVANKQLLGDGELGETRAPVYRLTYKNGMIEDVLDKWGELKDVDLQKTEVQPETESDGTN